MYSVSTVCIFKPNIGYCSKYANINIDISVDLCHAFRINSAVFDIRYQIFVVREMKK